MSKSWHRTRGKKSTYGGGGDLIDGGGEATNRKGGSISDTDIGQENGICGENSLGEVVVREDIRSPAAAAGTREESEQNESPGTPTVDCLLEMPDTLCPTRPGWPLEEHVRARALT